MSFSESALLDLYSVTCKGMHLSELPNRQAILLVYRPRGGVSGGPGAAPSLARSLALALRLLPLLPSLLVV